MLFCNIMNAVTCGRSLRYRQFERSGAPSRYLRTAIAINTPVILFSPSTRPLDPASSHVH